MDWYHRAITIENININKPIIEKIIPIIAAFFFMDFKPIFPKIKPKIPDGKVIKRIIPNNVGINSDNFSDIL